MGFQTIPGFDQSMPEGWEPMPRPKFSHMNNGPLSEADTWRKQFKRITAMGGPGVVIVALLHSPNPIDESLCVFVEPVRLTAKQAREFAAQILEAAEKAEPSVHA